MPSRYCIDPATGLALVEKAGDFAATDLIASARQLHEDPAWEPRYDVIWDCTGITSLVILPGELPDVVEAHLEDSCGRDLILVGRAVDYAIAHLCAYLSRREGKDAHVYRTMDELLGSLGRDALPEALQAWRQAA